MHKQLLIIVITMFCGSVVASSTLSGSLTNMKPFGKHRYRTDCAYYAARLEPRDTQSSVVRTENPTDQQNILRDLAEPQQPGAAHVHDDNYAVLCWLFLILKSH